MVVHGVDGLRTFCVQEWLICALKVIIVVICVGVLTGASTYAFGAAGIFGSTIAHAMGVPVTNMSLVMGVLCTAGGILIAETIACVRLAYKHKMGEYTGKDLEDAQNFLIESAEKIYCIVKDIFITRLNDLIDVLSDLEDVGNEKGSAFRHIVHEMQELEETATSKETKKRIRILFKKMRCGEKPASQMKEKPISDVIRTLEEEGRQGVKKPANAVAQTANCRDPAQLIDTVISHLRVEAKKAKSVVRAEVIEESALSPRNGAVQSATRTISDMGMRKVRAVMTQSVNELMRDPELLEEILASGC